MKKTISNLAKTAHSIILVFASLLFIVALLYGAFFAGGVIETKAGTSHNVSGFAWSDNVGWISFNCSDSNSCNSVDYGVNIAQDGILSGYAWNDIMGWTSFNKADLAGCASGACEAKLVNNKLQGWARTLSYGDGWDGWISLGGGNYEITLNGNNFEGFAWDSNIAGASKIGTGWVHFNPPLGGVIYIPPLVATCSPDKTVALTGDNVNWSATSAGGIIGSYSYLWSGTDGLTGNTKTVSKSYAINGAKTASVKVTSGSQSTTVGCNSAVTVASTLIPDLTTNMPTVSGTLIAGENITFSGNVMNTGNADISGLFDNLFEVDIDSNGSYDATIATQAQMSGLNASETKSAVSALWTNIPVGTHTVQLCADSGNVINEANEVNNCSPSKLVITVSSGLIVPPIAIKQPTISCSPPVIEPGEKALIKWQCFDSTDSAGFNFSTGGAVSGSAIVKPTDNSTEYTVVCSNNGQNSCFVAVNNPDLNISANPSRVRIGNKSTISWSAVNVNSCAVSGPNFSATGISGSKQTAPIEQQSVYTLICQSDSGPSSKAVTIKINPDFTEF